MRPTFREKMDFTVDQYLELIINSRRKECFRYNKYVIVDESRHAKELFISRYSNLLRERKSI